MLRTTLIIALLISICFVTQAQDGDSKNDPKEEKIIQLTGLVVNQKTHSPVPFATIYVPNALRGTISDYLGYFSIVVSNLDTIEFSALGYKKAQLIVPDTITEKLNSIILELKTDTIELAETVVYPWPSKEDFKEAFLNLRIPDDDIERARKNMARETLAKQYEYMAMDGSMNHTAFMNTKIHQMSTYNMQPQSLTSMVNNPLLNPFAWVKFIEAIKNGDFKRKDR